MPQHSQVIGIQRSLTAFDNTAFESKRGARICCALQVGLLRVVLSLEDKGPPTTAPAAAALTSPSIPSSFRQQQRSSSSHNHSHSPLTTPDKLYSTLTPLKQIHAPSSSTPAPAAQAATPYAQRQQQLQQGMAAAKTGRPSAAPQQVVAGETGDLSVVAAPAEMQDDAIAGAAAAAAAVAAAGVAMPPGDFRQMPEYLVAWELEVWKRVRAAVYQGTTLLRKWLLAPSVLLLAARSLLGYSKCDIHIKAGSAGVIARVTISNAVSSAG